MLIGESISEDVEAWDWLDDHAIAVTRGARTFVVRVEEITPDEETLELAAVTAGGVPVYRPGRAR